MLQRLLNNHVLANLTFALVLVIGFIAYNMLPRQQDPTINFNWIAITTILPGASAQDVAMTCHAHPTYSEAVREAALACGDGAIHA